MPSVPKGWSKAKAGGGDADKRAAPAPADPADRPLSRAEKKAAKKAEKKAS
jgi:hypothetical protein